MNDHLRGLTAAVDSELLAGLDPRRGTLEAAMHYALTVSGKRLRPLLFLTLVEALGREARHHVGLASALEIIHTYSLIHDDLPVMDDDDLRRGMPTVHKKFNEAIALLAGDTLLTFAFEKIAAAPLPAAQVVEIMGLLTRCIGKEGMAQGQALDLEFRGDAARIAEIHRLKTAELIKGSLLAADIVAGCDPGRRLLLERAGIALGTGFQLADDLLDVTGDEKEAGKKLRKDGGNQSPNAVLYFGLEAVRARIDELYREAVGLVGQLGIGFPPFLFLMKSMLYRSQ
ncbi:MAG: polyprenyl synthetase family protein [Acidobacteria bacterium]|jgi:geranylgeranyl pyrophosphate synthase|nr:polyprenyl synthetase family protein [Acidobacteriota bacterium]